MFEVSTDKLRRKVEKAYSSENTKFPLVYSVLTARQHGRILVNDLNAPTSYFISHHFGWSQIVGSDPVFLSCLKKFLFEDEAFSCLKLRAYVPDQSQDCIFECADRAERCQLRLTEFNPTKALPLGSQVHRIDHKNIHQLKTLDLELIKRSWRSTDSFLQNTFGYFVVYRNRPVAVCYSCANMNNIHEIDVYTAPEARSNGFARLACAYFISECLQSKLVPNWDCFTNNEASMGLAKSLGFRFITNHYSFYTYSRKKV